MRCPRCNWGAASAANGTVTVVAAGCVPSAAAGNNSPEDSGRVSTLPTASSALPRYTSRVGQLHVDQPQILGPQGRPRSEVPGHRHLADRCAAPADTTTAPSSTAARTRTTPRTRRRSSQRGVATRRGAGDGNSTSDILP